MHAGFVLVGRALEERAKLRASADMVALQVCVCVHVCSCVCACVFLCVHVYVFLCVCVCVTVDANKVSVCWPQGWAA